MKKTLLTFAFAFLTGAIAMAQNVASDIEGSYKGNIYVNLSSPVDDETEAIPEQSVNIVADGENSVTLSLYDFSFSEMLLGDIVLEKVPVSTAADNTVVFGENAPKSFVFHATVDGEYLGDILATAKVNEETSFVNGLNLTADIDVVWDNNGELVPIYVRFDGTRPVPEGIAAAAASAKTTAVYTLAGVRVAESSTKGLPAGIYIVNGKKIFVK